MFPKNCFSESFVLSVKHNKRSIPIVFFHIFKAYESKFFPKNFFGGFQNSWGSGGKKCFLKINNFFILIFIKCLILYLNFLFFSDFNHI